MSTNVEAGCETSPSKPLKDSSIIFSDAINLYLQPPKKTAKKKQFSSQLPCKLGDFFVGQTPNWI